MVWPTPFDEKYDEFDAMPLPGRQVKASYADSLLDHILNYNTREETGCQRVTCIAANIGTSSKSVQVLEQLIAAGMNVAIITLYFSTVEENVEIIQNIKQAARNYSVGVGRMYPLAIGVRLVGRKIRTGKIAESYGTKVDLRIGEIMKLTTDEIYRTRCSASVVFIDYPDFIDHIEPDDYITIDSEEIKVKVVSVSGVTAVCKIEKGNMLGSFKSVVHSGACSSMPHFTDRDKEFIKMALDYQVDIIIPSYVTNETEIIELRNLLGERGKGICIMAGIETLEGCRNFQKISAEAGAILITRQELKNIYTQSNTILTIKNMVVRANKAHIPVFVSAFFLTSMRYRKVPLRSELMDVGNSVLDGVDGLVLTSETAVGQYPVETILQLSQACKEAEACLWTRKVFLEHMRSLKLPVTIMTSLALAAVLASNRMVASAIVLLTRNLECAKAVSKMKPRCPIIAVTRHSQIARQLHLLRGVIPLCYEETPELDWQFDVEKRVVWAIKWAMNEGFVRIGDPFLILSGWQSSSSEVCNMRVDTAKGIVMVWPTPYDAKLDQDHEKPLPGLQRAAAFADSMVDHIMKLDMKEPPGCQRLTCIACNIGPASKSVEVLEQMMAAGMNIALITLYFMTYEENIEILKNLHKAVKNYSNRVGRTYPLAIGVRLFGRKIRTGKIAEAYGKKVELRTGDMIRITTDETYRNRCSANNLFVDYLYFISQIKPDDYINIDNDKIKLTVHSVSTVSAVCKIIKGGTLKSYRDVIVPYTVFHMPNFTDSDKEFIKFAVQQQVDIIIPTCVNNERAVMELKDLLGERGKRICIMADIQTIQGYRNFDRICKVSDAILLSRQELGNVISQKNMMIAIKNLVAKANKACIAIFVSAQFLESMRHKKAPLRSELLDIGNTVLDGADGLVLTGETAKGKYAVESILQMAQACKEAEACIFTRRVFTDFLRTIELPHTQLTSLGYGSVLASNRMVASAIVVLTQNLESAKAVSRFKPRCPIIAVTRHSQIARQLHIWRGVIPLYYDESPEADWQLDVEKRVSYAIQWALENGFVRIGDRYVILSGWRSITVNICNMRIAIVS